MKDETSEAKANELPNKSPEEILKELDNKSKNPEDAGKKQNKQLRNILIGIGVFVILIIAGVLFNNSIRNFEYEGVKFDIVREGDLILYNTKLALYNSQGEHYMNYNFFLRNDPRKSDVEFNGSMELKKLIVLDSDEDFNCDGDGIIAVANLRQLFEIVGAEVIRDENATCDSEERYTYINLKSGNQTLIQGTGSSCYNILINNCEILEGTEKFMVETFVKIG